MSFEDIKNITRGFLKGWKKGKLKEKCIELANHALDEKVKIAELENKVENLKDEILRLKGQKPKPKIKPACTDKELNPKPPKKHQKKNKKQDIEVDEIVEIDVDKSELPSDAKKIGSREIVIQEMVIARKNVKFIIYRYFSQELGRTIEGKVPVEFKGHEFGPQLRSFVLYQYYKCRTPHNKILQMLNDWGIFMSAGTLCSILNKLKDEFKADHESARLAALKKQNMLYIDDTGARIMGQNGYTYGVSNDYFTEYHTGLEKNRWSAVGALLGGPQKFKIDDEAISFVATKLRRAKVTVGLYQLKGRLFNQKELDQAFSEIYDREVTKYDLDYIRTAGAISALRSNDNGPPIKFLVSDDGSNFINLIQNQQLCWVHEIRKYIKMQIYHGIQKEALDQVIPNT